MFVRILTNLPAWYPAAPIEAVTLTSKHDYFQMIRKLFKIQTSVRKDSASCSAFAHRFAAASESSRSLHYNQQFYYNYYMS
jgi:hypothetical protein